MFSELVQVRETRMDALAAMDMGKLLAKSGIPESVAQILSDAGCNTYAIVALSSSGSGDAFLTAMKSMTKDTEVKDWQLLAVYGFVNGRLNEINALVSPSSSTAPPPVKEESPPAKTAAEKAEEDLEKYILEVQGELGIKSLSVPMTVLKGLLTEVGPEGISIKEKVAKLIVQVRKGKGLGQELVMQVSGSGDCVPKMAVGMGTRKAVWALSRKNWGAFITFARKVRKILARAAPGDEGEEATMAWEHFVEYLVDLCEIYGEEYAAEYFVQYTTEFDFCFSDEDGKIRTPKEDKIVMLTRRSLKEKDMLQPDEEYDGFRGDKKKGDKKKSGKKAPVSCLKCGADHSVFQCPEKCKTAGMCIVCGKDRKECTSMWDCAERHENSK